MPGIVKNYLLPETRQSALKINTDLLKWLRRFDRFAEWMFH